MEVKIHYKVELLRRGKKIKDLSDVLKMDYTKISRILNGFVHEPTDFDSKIKKVLARWDETAAKEESF